MIDRVYDKIGETIRERLKPLAGKLKGTEIEVKKVGEDNPEFSVAWVSVRRLPTR